MNKQYLLTKEEINQLSKLIANTNIIAKRAINEGYMTDDEITDTIRACEFRTQALAKLICQTVEYGYGNEI